MPYRPISRPDQIRSLDVERRSAQNAGTRTVAGTPEKAKLVAKSFMRGSGSDRDRAPAWGPDSRSFSEQRQLNPDVFRTWGDQLATTNTGIDFMAPPEPSPLTRDEEVL